MHVTFLYRTRTGHHERSSACFVPAPEHVCDLYRRVEQSLFLKVTLDSFSLTLISSNHGGLSRARTFDLSLRLSLTAHSGYFYSVLSSIEHKIRIANSKRPQIRGSRW